MVYFLCTSSAYTCGGYYIKPSLFESGSPQQLTQEQTNINKSHFPSSSSRMTRIAPLLVAFSVLLALGSSAPVQKANNVHREVKYYPVYFGPSASGGIALGGDGTVVQGGFNGGSGKSTGGAFVVVAADDYAGAGLGAAVGPGSSKVSASASPGYADAGAKHRTKPRGRNRRYH